MTDNGSKTSAAGPLDGVTVLDLTRILSGPYCTMILGDMGARVIKIEQTGRGDDTRAWGPPFINGESGYFLSVNRNKLSVTLDFKHEAGRKILDSLIDQADVLVENFRPGTLDKIGLGYTEVSQRWPKLIYCSVSGFGQTGPKRKLPGYDAVVQAEGGLMSITGPRDGTSYRLGVAIADIVSGMFAAQGITLALLSRERTGRGQLVDIAMLDSVAALLTYQAGIYFATGTAPVRMGNRHPTIVPYETFEASDGDFVIAVGNDEQWQRFCQVTGLKELAKDPKYTTNAERVSAYDELRPKLAEHLRTKKRQYWIEVLASAGITCGSVRDLGEVLTDPHLVAREMIAKLPHPLAGQVDTLGTPIKLSDTPGSLRTAAPTIGQHTDEVLRLDLNLDQNEIDQLRKNEVI